MKTINKTNKLKKHYLYLLSSLIISYITLFSCHNIVQAQTSVSGRIPQDLDHTDINGLHNPLRCVFDYASSSGSGYNTWCNRIITKEELNAAGIGAGATLSAIQFYMNTLDLSQNASFFFPDQLEYSNQFIWIKHIGTTTALTSIDNPNPTSPDFTQVFNGSLTYSATASPSWYQINFTSNFVWNGTDNIQIVTQNKHAFPSILSLNWPFFATVGLLYSENRMVTATNPTANQGSVLATPDAPLTRFVYSGGSVPPASTLPTIVGFTTPGAQTWVCPAGVSSITVECWGGGGGGGGANWVTSSRGGSGGGSGAYVKKVGLPVTPGTTYNLSVGASGAAGSGFGGGSAGGDSWFNSTSTILAKGGCGGEENLGAPGTGGCSASCGSGNVCIPSSGSGPTDYFKVGNNGVQGTNSLGQQGGHFAGYSFGGGSARSFGPGMVGRNLGGGGGGGFASSATSPGNIRPGGAGGIGGVRITYTDAPSNSPTIISFTPAVACVGETITITGTDLIGPIAVSVGGVPVTSTITVNNANSASFLVPAGAVSGVITYTTNFGTASSPTAITIVPNISVSPSTATICLGGSVSLTASGASNFIWSPTAGLSSSNTATVIASPSQTTIYTVSNANGNCSGSANVTVNPSPNVLVLPSNPTICKGESITLNATGATNYVWNPGNIQGSALTVAPESTSTYVLEAVSENCNSNIEVTVQVLELPIADFDFEQQASSYLINFYNNSSNASDYLWNFGGFNSSTQQNPSFGYPFDGVYPVTLIASNQCGSDTITINVRVLKLNLEDIMLKNGIRVFPNPSIDNIYFEFDDSKVYVESVSLFDISGKLIIKKSRENNESSINNLNLDSYQTGIYLLQVNTNISELIFKVIKL